MTENIPPDLNLAAVGNCSFNALIDKRGAVVWSCMPRPDSNPVFSALISGMQSDDAAVRGVFDIIVDGVATCTQSYIDNTPVLVTRFETVDAAFEVVDFAPRFVRFGRKYRPVALVRLLRPLYGTPRIKIRLRPAFGFAADAGAVTHGSNHIRYVTPAITLRLTTDASLSYVLNETFFRLDRSVTLFLGPDETLTIPISEIAEDYLSLTSMYWKEWTRTLAIPFEWQEAVVRAAITLKLCWFEETGGIIAAMTTSIPESAHSGRNWDYRYCWLRDAYYVIRALNRLGAIDILESYIVYLNNLPDVDQAQHLQPVYGIALEHVLDEREERGLLGYRGMGPVRVGNQAYQHHQYDVYGQVILSAMQGFFDTRLLRPLDVTHFKRFEALGMRAYDLYDKPDAGLWELRTKSRVHTYSSMMCWAACDRLGRIAAELGLDERAMVWRERAAEMKQTILKKAWNEDEGHFTGSFGGTELDASLLQLGELGLVEPDDIRFHETVKKLESRLRQGKFVFRYIEEDDFGKPTNAFTFCSFWFIDALHFLGRADEAREVFEQMLACRNHVGLMSEHVDIGTHELWGNFPQTYALAGIINAATRLSRPWAAML